MATYAWQKQEMKFLLVGDAHLNAGFMRSCIMKADELEVDALIQLGDFGFWPGYAGEVYLTGVRFLADKHSIPVWVIDGNHDWPELYQSLSTQTPSTLVFDVQHIARGTILELGEKSVGFLGSAVSIDQTWRRKHGHGWWPEEELSNRDVIRAHGDGTTIDIMLSHDAPMPPGFTSSRFDEETMVALHRQRTRFNDILNIWKPKLHVHGHWHMRYSCPTPWGTRIGLGAEGISSSVVLLDTDDLSCY